MSSIPAFGTSLITSDIAFLLQDQLDGMGDFMSQEVGSLNWIEAFTFARSLDAAKKFITLLSNQLSPNSASVYLSRWAKIYSIFGASNAQVVSNHIETIQAEVGEPPILSNLISYLEEALGTAFIDLEWTPELQSLATTDGYNQIVVSGNNWSAPLNKTMVYVWQPRDNQDNLLMQTSVFSPVVESYRAIMENWNPSYVEFITMNLSNRGNQDGYGNNYNGVNFNNYLDGYNVISGSASSTTITGINTAFLLYPNGYIGDFAGAVNEGYNPPLQVVDDSNVMQTYYVLSVQSNTKLTLTTPLINNITTRTYRTLGVILDQSGMLDSGALFNV